MDSHFHVTELSSSGASHGGSGAVGPLFIVLAIIMVLGLVAGFVGRICAGRHWGGDTQYDFEGWVEKRCATCIDGDIEAPPPPPPEKPPDPNAPPPEVPPPAVDAPPPAEPPPAPADQPPPAEAPPAADAAAAPEGAAPPPAEAPAPPAEPQPPPPPPPPPPEADAGGAAAAYAGPTRTEPLTYMQLYPSYSCRCHICAREGIFE